MTHNHPAGSMRQNEWEGLHALLILPVIAEACCKICLSLFFHVPNTQYGMLFYTDFIIQIVCIVH